MISKNQTILIVDDTETNIDILLELLDGYDVAVATDGALALEIVASEEIDLILLDIMMPNMDGYEVCRRLKENAATNDIPVIFITAKTDEKSIEKAYEVGGIDYITKPFKPKELLARVKTQLSMQTLLSHLQYLASYDSMTGIYNRRKFFELALEKFDASQSLCAVMIDIDKFKIVNDSHGYPFGDIVIKEVTNTIASLVDEQSAFGRLGGEEFAIVFANKTLEEVYTLCERMRKSVADLVFMTQAKEEVQVTISLGIAVKDATTSSLDHLLKEADDALYTAKNEGRNRSIFRV